MALSVEAMLKASNLELLTAYYDTRRSFAEKKFARDSQRARLEWQRAKAFAATSGGVSERNSILDSSEELGRKGQEVRDMTRELDLLKADVDLLATLVRMRVGVAAGDNAALSRPEDDEHVPGPTP